jgi:hypothetical protein
MVSWKNSNGYSQALPSRGWVYLNLQQFYAVASINALEQQLHGLVAGCGHAPANKVRLDGQFSMAPVNQNR